MSLHINKQGETEREGCSSRNMYEISFAFCDLNNDNCQSNQEEMFAEETKCPSLSFCNPDVLELLNAE